MPVVVVAALMVVLTALMAPSEAAQSCASKPEAQPDSGSVSAIWWDQAPELAPAVDRPVTTEPQSPTAAPVVACKSEPAATPPGLALVVIAVAMTLGTIEVLFRCTIYERPHSTDHRQTKGKEVKRTTASWG